MIQKRGIRQLFPGLSGTHAGTGIVRTPDFGTDPNGNPTFGHADNSFIRKD
jgi:hypothetical protein